MRALVAILLLVGCGADQARHLVYGRVVRKEIQCAGDVPQPTYDLKHERAPAPDEEFIVRRARRRNESAPLKPFGPVIVEFRSKDDGSFTLDLAEGTYCVSRARAPARCWKTWEIPDPDVQGERVMQVSDACPGAGGR